MKLYPLKFEPIFKERIWGGQGLRKIFGKEIDANLNIGESWELADLPEDKSVICNGQLAGVNIAEAMERFGDAISGKEGYRGPFGLLIKFLDACQTLSVQVHPDADTCKRTGKGDPKTECWYVIAADKGAFIYKSLKAGTTRENFKAAIEDGTVDRLLEKVEVQVGQCHMLPAGTAHAIGPGLLIAEIQTPSDTTYRVFDFNRKGPDGKPRQLHIEEAMEAIHFDASGDDLSVRTDGRLVESDVFTVDKLELATESQVEFADGQMRVLIIIEGSGSIAGDETETVNYSAGDTILLPAVYEGIMRADSATVCLIAMY